ncbi:MAG: prepilin-type N-terminal cleavage/methylation domain-containing protein [Acidobacteria bacterium]|nr:prepilin-type N-terminal cleavage/methylation domain-containing protein [Acidobacteriota bacterium]MCL5288685.1 prepilin-type N-terminal cleavage/methylation domain-containing protein [Acidobacteriota bacterium]
MKLHTANRRGFSLLEMLISVAVFTVVMAAVFGLLIASQQRYQAETDRMDTFQGARQAMDLMVRDIHIAGYPPANNFSPAVIAANPERVALPFGWSPNYPATPCTVGVNCNAIGGPAPFDLIIETDVDPLANNGLEWVRYRLNGTVLERGMATKIAGADPENSTQAVMVPYVENVMNNTTAAQMAFLQGFYPGLFPGNTPVPVFTYQFDAGAANVSTAIRSVNITLIVLARNVDPKTRQPIVVTLTGYSRRVNP